MSETPFDIAHIANRFRQFTVDIHTAIENPAVDQPVLPFSTGWADLAWPQLVGIDVLPSLLAFDHMRVGINGWHGSSSRC